MKAAIVTGASSGIGLAVSRMLDRRGMRVYGVGRTFPEEIGQLCPNMVPLACDLMDITKVQREVQAIRKQGAVSLLVNGAGVGYFGLHEEISPAKLHEMVTVNIEIPLILSQMLLRDFKKHGGTIINISSVTAKKRNAHGCAYGATKAALTSFTESLFDEARKYGVKAVSIHPDMTASNFYRNADFQEAEAEECRLVPEEVADAVAYVLDQRNGIAITDLVLQPQKHRIERKRRGME